MSLQCVKYLMRCPANPSPTLKYKLQRQIVQALLPRSGTNCTDIPTSWDQVSNIAPTLHWVQEVQIAQTNLHPGINSM